jgi:hypothetical protein
VSGTATGGRIHVAYLDLLARKILRGRGILPPLYPLGFYSPSDWPSRRLQDSRANPL